MKIKADLVYRKCDGKLVGFCEMGSVNDEIQRFQNAVEGIHFLKNYFL